jgi:phage terminase large subunit GpA-like protein
MDDYDGAHAIERAWRDGLTPDPLLTVSQWADRYRVLSQRASSEPGRWRTERTPYLREIMDCLSPASPVQRVALMKGAQIGGTECGNCWIGYVIHQAPGPMMAVAPTVELAKRNSKQRLDPLIEESEVLRERVKERRSRDSGNTVLSKEFPGGVLILTGANSAVGLRSMPARYLFLDEVDGTPATSRARAIRSCSRNDDRRRSSGARPCWSRRRRPKDFRESSGSTRRATSGGSSCRVRTAASTRRWSSRTCAGRRGGRAPRSTPAPTAAR